MNYELIIFSLGALAVTIACYAYSKIKSLKIELGYSKDKIRNLEKKHSEEKLLLNATLKIRDEELKFCKENKKK